MMVQLGLQNLFIEGLGVQLIAWSSFHRISQVPHYNVILLFPLLQLSPALINRQEPKERELSTILLRFFLYIPVHEFKCMEMTAELVVSYLLTWHRWWRGRACRWRMLRSWPSDTFGRSPPPPACQFHQTELMYVCSLHVMVVKE